MVAVAAAGMVVSVRRRGVGLDEWFVAAYAGVLVLYFATADRLTVPLLPFVYAYWIVAATAGWRAVRTRWPRAVHPSVAVLPVVAVLLAPAPASCSTFVRVICREEATVGGRRFKRSLSLARSTALLA